MECTGILFHCVYMDDAILFLIYDMISYGIYEIFCCVSYLPSCYFICEWSTQLHHTTQLMWDLGDERNWAQLAGLLTTRTFTRTTLSVWTMELHMCSAHPKNYAYIFFFVVCYWWTLPISFKDPLLALRYHTLASVPVKEPWRIW